MMAIEAITQDVSYVRIEYGDRAPYVPIYQGYVWGETGRSGCTKNWTLPTGGHRQSLLTIHGMNSDTVG